MAEFHLAWIATLDPQRRRGGYQGAHHHLWQAMRPRVDRLSTLAPLDVPPDRLALAQSRLLTLVAGQRRLWPYSDRRLRRYAAAAESWCAAQAPDAVLFFGSAAHLLTRPSVPYSVFFDSAFVPYLEFYEVHRRYTSRELARLARHEALWLAGAHRVFASSRYALDAIRRRYPDVPPDRLVPVGIGPNFEPAPMTAPPSASGASGATPRDAASGPRVLLVATDFARKGGALAIAAVERARQRLPGLTLDLIGTAPPPDWQRPFVHCHGWLDPTTPDGAARFSARLRDASLFLLFSAADLTPNAIAEAFAHRLPVLAFATGGIPEMVSDGANGWLLPAGADADRVAARMVAILTDATALDAARTAAENASATTWNWARVAESVAHGLRPTPDSARLASP